MSLVDRKVESRLIEKSLTGNSKLVLTDNIMDQIDYLHKIVGNVEWSGVLVYKVTKGSIEDYKNLEVEVLEILPMDVGTSGYTEYTLDSKDDYTFNNLCDRVMMDPDLKIGHIHTHHGMGCFFSGTDTQELHDNAPNHNYYLSLIVNFKDFDNWCSKIALVGEERQTGTLASKFKGTKGNMVENLIEINNTKEVLYTIDMDISYANQSLQSSEFKNRVLSLNKEQGRSYSTINTHFSPIYKKHGTQGDLFSKDVAPKVNLQHNNIAVFTNKLISVQSPIKKKLLDNIILLDSALHGSDDESMVRKTLYIDNLLENFEPLFEEHFKCEVDILSNGSIKVIGEVVKKVVKILSFYRLKYDFIEDVIEELELNYILDIDHFENNNNFNTRIEGPSESDMFYNYNQNY